MARSLEIAEGTLWNCVKDDREATERAADTDALSECEREELCARTAAPTAAARPLKRGELSV